MFPFLSTFFFFDGSALTAQQRLSILCSPEMSFEIPVPLPAKVIATGSPAEPVTDDEKCNNLKTRLYLTSVCLSSSYYVCLVTSILQFCPFFGTQSLGICTPLKV